MQRKTDRREFMRNGLLATAAVFAGGAGGLLGPRVTLADELPDLAISYGSDPAAMTRAAVDALGGMARFVKPGNKVVIKPNMSFEKGPASGCNTDPLLVREVARLCAEAGASKVSVLDNPLTTPGDCLRLSQIPDKCRDIPNTAVNYAKADRFFREVKVEKGVKIKSMKVMADVLDSDVLIAVPVGKSHSSSGVSMGMKGMMGLIRDRMAFHHRDLDECIVDMVTVLKPDLTVIDGTRILSSGGPGGSGKIIPLNVVIASPDVVAADAQMVALGTWYNRKLAPSQVKHVRIAAERGLGRMDLEQLKVKTIKA